MAGMAITTVDVLRTITCHFITPKTFMTDEELHFNNATALKFCSMNGCKHHVTSAYSPWVHGLVEGSNQILLHILHHLYTPEISNNKVENTWDALPRNWPEHLDKAVWALNH